MKKRLTALALAILCGSTVLGGCSGLLPFAEEAPMKNEGQKAAEVKTEKVKEPTEEPEKEKKADSSKDAASEAEGAAQADVKTDKQRAAELETVLAHAGILAAQYNYDRAIELLKSQPEFGTDAELQNAAAEYESIKATCVEYPIDQITHVFYHTLIKDTSKAFDGDSDEAGYNQVMTTIDEFNRITQSMYDKGYVLVSPHDMATVNADGTMTVNKIMLPPGKIPFVLSQDDVSYYHYMNGDGFARRLVLDENKKVKCEYVEDDGSVSVGDYDLVPLLDAFVEAHPDFSYHGRKGILAMTGYEGVLGYRTDIAYKTRENLEPTQQEFLDSHPDFNYEEEVAQATAVANAMKENGWEFASHTWGHKNATTATAEELQTDNEKWEAYVAPILGKTDMIIFAFGADIGDWEPYTMDNPKFAYFKSRGYHYYCNVDSSQYWVQTSEQFLRQGRRNLDGYRMYYNPEMLSDLFDVASVWDSSRPTPVPAM